MHGITAICRRNGRTYRERDDPLRQTRRRFGGRQPLCGIGVTSRIVAISRPVAESARIADSRPEPGPFTCTSTRRSPRSLASLAASGAATWAAYGVFLRLRLVPCLHGPAHDIL